MPRNIASVPSVTTSDGRPSAGDQNAVEGAGQRRRERAPAAMASGKRRPGLDQHAEDDAGQRQDAGDRKVDLAGDDEQHHGQHEQRLLRHARRSACDMLKRAGEVRARRARRRRTAASVSSRQEGLPARPALTRRRASSRRRLGHAAATAATSASMPIGDQDDQAVDALEPERIDPHERQAVRMTSSVSAPSADARARVPAPPRIATPPTTTAAITVSSKPSATRASMVA